MLVVIVAQAEKGHILAFLGEERHMTQVNCGNTQIQSHLSFYAHIVFCNLCSVPIMTPFFGCLVTVRSAHTSSFCWKHPIFWYRSHWQWSNCIYSQIGFLSHYSFWVLASSTTLLRSCMCVCMCVCNKKGQYSWLHFQQIILPDSESHEKLDSIMLVTCKHLMLFSWDHHEQQHPCGHRTASPYWINDYLEFS